MSEKSQKSGCDKKKVLNMYYYALKISKHLGPFPRDFIPYIIIFLTDLKK